MGLFGFTSCTDRLEEVEEQYTGENEVWVRLIVSRPYSGKEVRSKAGNDRETEIDGVYPTEHITREGVETVLRQFVGSIQQVPPVYSACKIDGRRAYDFARKGEDVELKAKELVIDEIELLEYQSDIIKIRVVCSKGTYIRALARDIGQALDSGAHLIGLVRTRVGDVRLEDCLQVDQIDELVEKAVVTEVDNKEEIK